jgi:hypothetical protein
MSFFLQDLALILNCPTAALDGLEWEPLYPLKQAILFV